MPDRMWCISSRKRGSFGGVWKFVDASHALILGSVKLVLSVAILSMNVDKAMLGLCVAKLITTVNQT